MATATANRLINEKSPYLLQHAHNPVDWYPWGQEAFAKAKAENKPIFLSVGYSTCHWCHVMERESFENKAIADIMNQNFVNIKVDREERPDVDKVYMTYVMATQGSGGWPMSVFLTSDLKPFFGGTYFPPQDSFGSPGFPTVLTRLSELWKNQRDRILRGSEDVLEQINEQILESAQVAESEDLGTLAKTASDKCYEQLAKSYDEKFGGFSMAPKFPRPVVLNFLLRKAFSSEKEKQKEKAQASSSHASSSQDSASQHQNLDHPALKMVLHTLEAMAKGGMHDQLGGGFHRYSTTRDWHIPHYEKMLYDQSQLAISYLEAYQITKRALFAEVARDVLDYVSSAVMTSPEGGFYSAEDADSLAPATRKHIPHQLAGKKIEGAFFVWEYEELAAILNQHQNQANNDLDLFCFVYGIEKHGNTPPGSDPHGELKGQNTLHKVHSVSEAAQEFKLSEAEVESSLKASCHKLWAVREQRPRPHLDDKIITSWNGLMISAFAKAFQVLGEDKYLQAAIRAASFIRSTLYTGQTGMLLRHYRNGPANVNGFCEDYAFLIQGLLDLYEASFDVSWLRWAEQLQKKQDELFWDSKAGGYFDAPEDKDILIRVKEEHDGAEPASNSISAINLIRMSHMLRNDEMMQTARKVILFFVDNLKRAPVIAPQMTVALQFWTQPVSQLVVAGATKAQDTKSIVQAIHSVFSPYKVILLHDNQEGTRFLAQHDSMIADMKPVRGAATLFVCKGTQCSAPITDVSQVQGLLLE